MFRSVAERHAFVARLGEVGEQHRRQRAADAEPHDVRLGRAGDLPDDRKRRLRPVEEVVLQRDVPQGRIRVAVADCKHGVAMRDSPLDEAPPGGEIHDVVLVDPRRTAEQGDLEDGLRLRRVLDQLHQLVAEDDLAGRAGQVLTDGERREINLTRHPAVGGEVLEEVAEAADEARPAGLEGPLEGGWVAPEIVARCERVGDKLCCELRL